MSYKNIIFDLGGVLVGLDGQRCIEAFMRIGCPEVARYVELHLTEDLFVDIEMGNISTHDFCNEVRRLTGCAAADSEIVAAWNALLTEIPNHKKQLLLDLREQGKRLFLLSNTNDMHWTYTVEQLLPMGPWGASDYFEQTFVSYEMHLAKPSEEIYSEVLRQTGIKANETLFIDDSRDNIEAARRLGIHGFLETTGEEWMKEVVGF